MCTANYNTEMRFRACVLALLGAIVAGPTLQGQAYPGGWQIPENGREEMFKTAANSNPSAGH